MLTLAIISSQAFSLVNFRGPLIKKLVAKGVHVYVLAPDFDDDLREKIRDIGGDPIDFRLARTGMNPWRDLVDTLQLVKVLKKLRPNITLSYFIKPVIYGTFAAWLAKVPRRIALIEGLGYVYTLASEDLPWRRKLLRVFVNGLYKMALSRSHRVIFLNDDDISEFRNTRLVSDDKIEKIVGIGVDLEEWEYTPPVVDPLTFLLAARLLREKGVVEFAQAAKQIKARHPDVRFVLLGGLDPNPSGLSKEDVEAWNEESMLKWYGHVDVKPWMQKASVYVLPSYREGVPRSTQEAMAVGRAIITTDVPGCRETVVNGVNGFFVPARDPGALAEAMLKFIRDPSLIEKMGKESRRLAEERFDVNLINRRLMDILGVQ